MLVLWLFSASALLGDPFSTFVGAVEPVPVAPPQGPDDWSDLPLEASEDDRFKWEFEDSRERGNQKDTKAAEVALYPLKNVAHSSTFDELGGDIPLEGEVPPLRGETKNSALAQTKRFAAEFVLAAPCKEKLTLLRNDIQSGKDLEKFHEQENKRKKRRGKLELQRLQRQQRKKYDSKVELIEQNASRKRRRFKSLRKLFRYLRKLLEGSH